MTDTGEMASNGVDWRKVLILTLTGPRKGMVLGEAGVDRGNIQRLVLRELEGPTVGHRKWRNESQRNIMIFGKQRRQVFTCFKI